MQSFQLHHLLETQLLIWLKLIKRHGKFDRKNKKVTRRQDAPKYFDITTVGYVTRPNFILSKKTSFSGKVKSIIVPKERAIDIDDLTDAYIAEFLYERSK